MKFSLSSAVASAARVTLVTISAVLFSALGSAAVILPTASQLGLTAGDQYAFVFVTSGTLLPSSTNIAFYNNFVRSAATAGGLDFYLSSALTWNAIVSTGQTSGTTTNTNAPVGNTVKVFRVDGVMVANGSSSTFYATGTCDLFTCMDHLAPINITELGTSLSTLPSAQSRVWTGAQGANGGGSGSGLVGTSATPVYGNLNGTIGVPSSGSSWMRDGNAASTNSYRLYALSNTLTAPTVTSDTPEPASVVLIGAGLAGLAVLRRRRA